MLKLLLICTALFGCSGSSGVWTSQQEKEFLHRCVAESRTQKSCECLLQILEDRIPEGIVFEEMPQFPSVWEDSCE